MKDRRFTDTELPVFSGEEEGWYRHIHIVQAIKKSNGWSDETAALQLFVHLKGEALDVALLLNKKVRETWTGLDRTDRTDRTDGVLPVPRQAGGAEKAVCGSAPPTGIGPSYFRN